MASIKVKFRPSCVAGTEGTIFYQIIHERKIRQLLSGYHILPAEWNPRRAMVVASSYNERGAFIRSVHEHIRQDIDRLNRIIRKLESAGTPYSADDIIDEFCRYCKAYSLFNYMERIIWHLKENGKFRTSETYRAALNSFRKFRNNEDLMLDCLTPDIMEAYSASHRMQGNVPNTISFYNRILRAVYNRAVEEDAIENRNPFRHVYTGVEKTVKRALPLPLIRELKNLDLTDHPKMEYARDMFMMSFYLRGMSFIDMAFLRKSDLKGGSIIYRRRKTGQQLMIGWTKEMQEILAQYPVNATEYLLPIITTDSTNQRYTYRDAAYRINRSLKRIARIIGITIPLTLYVARHSWASAAKANGIPLSIISEGMGHDSEATTRIYLASLDTSVIDKANALIIASI